MNELQTDYMAEMFLRGDLTAGRAFAIGRATRATSPQRLCRERTKVLKWVGVPLQRVINDLSSNMTTYDKLHHTHTPKTSLKGLPRKPLRIFYFAACGSSFASVITWPNALLFVQVEIPFSFCGCTRRTFVPLKIQPPHIPVGVRCPDPASDALPS